MIAEKIAEVRGKIEEACLSSGRDTGSVRLIAVSKTKPADMILEAYAAGQRDFGENYVQELREKAENLPSDIRWHMIGHLQRNKVKYIAPFITMIHAVDSVALAETIHKEALKCGRVIPVLLEVNAGGEESKFGFAPEEACRAAEEMSGLSGIGIDGLMTSAPYVSDEGILRPVFRTLAELDLDIKAKNYNNYKGSQLSMGMSNDYRIAIEEGSTMVRIGTDIFGARNYAH